MILPIQPGLDGLVIYITEMLFPCLITKSLKKLNFGVLPVETGSYSRLNKIM